MARIDDFNDQEPSYFSDDPVDFVEKKSNRLSAKINQSLMVFVFLITSSLFLGSTLAANITFTGGKTEFGQGVAGLKACSASNQVVIKQKAEYTLSGFKLKSIELSNIPVSCYGYDLIISILNPGAQGTNTLATLFSTVKRLIIFDKSGSFYVSQSDSSYVTLTSTHDSGTNTDSVLVSFNTASVLISDIGTLGIESSDNSLTSLPCGAGGDCPVGTTGPGGGTVVAIFDQPFQAPGSPCDLTCYGIEIDPAQVNQSDQWTKNSANSNVNGQTNATRSGMGAGYYNTKLAFESANGSNNSNARYGAIASCWNKTTSSATDRWYVPSVMEYVYIFQKIKENSAFRTSTPGWPAITNYYSSEEVTTSYSVAGYTTTFNNDGPPAGFNLEVTRPNTPDATQALAVAPASQITPSFVYTNSTFSNYSGMRVFNHPKNNGYAYICIHAFK